MTNKDKLLRMINNLNENGIDVLFDLFGDMDRKERYNINTTPERLAELQQIQKEKDEKRKEQLKADNMKASFERAQESYRRIKEKKASLTGKEKRLFELIESVKPGTYCMYSDETILFANVFDNNLVNGCYSIFRYGFLKGQRAEKAKQKRIREKAKAS